MELKSFFNEQHNLENVEVLGLPAKPEDTLRSLLRGARIRPHGAWMVDELIVPGDKDKTEMQKLHQQFSRDMEDLHNHINAQSQGALLWIAEQPPAGSFLSSKDGGALAQQQANFGLGQTRYQSRCEGIVQ